MGCKPTPATRPTKFSLTCARSVMTSGTLLRSSRKLTRQLGTAQRKNLKVLELNVFEAEVKNYVESFGKQIGQQQATFKLQSAAQLKAWAKRPISLAALQRIRRRTSGRNRRGREAHEHRRHRSRGKTPEAEPGRGPVMVRTGGCPDGNARCLRSCQSGSEGCVQASRLIKTADRIWRDRREAVFLLCSSIIKISGNDIWPTDRFWPEAAENDVCSNVRC